MKNLAICDCCGSELTAPQLFNGKVYGWTCIKKVNPKPPKKVVYIPIDKFKHLETEGSTRSVYAFTLCGLRGSVVAYSGRISGGFIQNGVLWVDERMLSKQMVNYWKEENKS